MEYRTKKRYSFKMKVGNATSVACHPIYSDLTHSWAKRDDEIYYEESFDGEFTFVGEDYERIVAAPITTKYELYIYRAEQPGVEYVKGVFRRSDGTTDHDRKTFKTKISLSDMYKALVYGKADERNLVKLKPKQGKMTYTVNPLLQLYYLGSSEMYHVSTGGHLSRTEVSPITDSTQMVSTYRWTRLNQFYAYCTEGSAKGAYCGCRYSYNYVNTYTLTGYKSGDAHNGYNITIRSSVQDQYDIWVTELGEGGARYSRVSVTLQDNVYTTLVMQKIDGPSYASDTITISFKRQSILARVCYYSEGDSSSFSLSLPFEDSDPMKPSNMNKISVTSNINLILMDSIGVTTDEDEGIRLVSGNSSGQFYYRDYSELVNQSIGTIYQDMWGTLWMPSESDRTFGYEEMAYQFGVHKDWYSMLRGSGFIPLAVGYTKTNNDWYLLTSVIEKLAKQCDSTIHFEDNRQMGGVCDSLFLFGNYNSGAPFNRTNILNGAAWGQLMVLQKSNILQLNYDSASVNAKITLEQVFTLLKNAFNCWYELYWWTNPSTGQQEKHLRIEHIQYYLNGHTYGTSSRTVRDLNSIVDKRNGKKMSYMSNNFSYADDRCANRYEFSWMDEQSEYFDGYTMKVPSEYNIWGNSKTEDRPIDWFSSDVDYLMANAGQCSYDGFVVAQTATWGSNIMNTYIYTDNEGANHTLQNGQLAMVYLQKQWMPWDIYAPKIRINDEEEPTDVVITSKLREHTLQFRLAEGETMNPEDVVKSGVKNGNYDALGVVESLKEDLSSNWVEAVVRYDCETDATTTPGGSGVIPSVVTDFDEDEVLGYIGSHDNVDMDVMIERFGSNVQGYVVELKSDNAVLEVDGKFVVNDGRYDYDKEEIKTYLQSKLTKTADALKENFGEDVMDYVNLLVAEGLVGTDGATYWWAYDTEDVVDYMAEKDEETTENLIAHFNGYVVETLSWMKGNALAWPNSTTTWKTTYIDVLWEMDIIERTIDAIAASGGSMEENALMQAVADGDERSVNVFEYMVFVGMLTKSDEFYVLA